MRLSLRSTCVFLLIFAAAAAGASTSAPDLDQPVTLTFPEPTPAVDVYQAWGRAVGVNVIFDPQLQDRRIFLELANVRAGQALDTLTRAAGHFATVLDEGTVLIAEDTPQMRRTYEKQVIRTFHLENLPLADAMTMVRTLVGAKNVAVNEGLNSLVVRDTAAKVEVIGELLRTIDKPRGEVAVRVDLLYLDAAALERWTGEANPLSADELAALRRTARRLTSQELNVLDGDRGLWTLTDKLAIAAADQVPFIEVGFELRVEPRVHAASDEVTLEVKVAASDATRSGPPVVRSRDLESGLRIRSGESFLVTGLQKMPTGEADSWLASRFDLPAGPGEVVLVLTPRIVRGPGFTESDLLALCVGTETRIELCGRDAPASVARR